MLRYQILSSLAESMGLEKYFTHYQYDTNFLYPTSYVQMYMTPLILKLKLREKSDFRL